MKVVAVMTRREIINAYKSYLDVSRFFADIDKLTLYEYTSGLLQWQPVIAGDSDFYNEISNIVKPYYPKSKNEYNEALCFIPECSKVLEIGCGSGQFGLLAQSKCDWTGVDINKEAISIAVNNGLNAITADLFSSKNDRIKNCNFDVIVSFQTIEHLTNPDDLFRFAKKKLKANGKLILGGPAHDSLLGTDPFIALNLPPHHLTWWPDKAYINYPRGFGFKCIKLLHCDLDEFHNQYFLGSLVNSIVKPALSKFGTKGANIMTGLIRRMSLLPLLPFINKGTPISPMFGIRGQSVLAIYEIEG